MDGLGLNIVKTKDVYADDSKLVNVAKVEYGVSKPVIYVPRGSKEAAVRASLVPEAYINCDFDIDKIKENQQAQMKVANRNYKVYNFDKYKDITLGILATIIANKIPKQSYIIGAPNGFGKTSFVNTCIMRLFDQGRNCAPYISLTDLAEIRFQHERRLLEGIKARDIYNKEYNESLIDDYSSNFYNGMERNDYSKKPINIVSRYSWSEYMNCDVLFCYFTDITSKVLESEIFKAVITIRGAKGLPTIAMISTSFDPYRRDARLSEYIWNEVMAYGSSDEACDRVKHVSCYKDYSAPLVHKQN